MRFSAEPDITSTGDFFLYADIFGSMFQTFRPIRE